MSEQNNNRNNRSGGNGGNRNRNQNRRGGQGSQGGNSRNRNQNNRGGNGGGGKAGEQRNELQPRNRRARKKPLTFWQKCLKAVGLYKEPAAPTKGGQKNDQKGGPNKKAAKKSGRVEGGGRTERNQGQGQKDGQKPRPQRKKTPPPTKVETPRLYVGNLSYDASEYDLEELFKGVGAVRKVELVYNRHTHKSKGYGFVNMGNMEEAERAVEVLHDQPFMGRKMIVNGARSKGPNDTSPGGDNDQSKADAPKQEETKQEETPAATPEAAPTPATPAAPAADIPAVEEVHSLAPEKE